ncbi:MAG: hypothetical protein RJB08_1918 [Actinomycetota bacterium]|jgi:hypothetical protein
MSMRLVRGTLVPIFGVAVLALASCGGSKDSTESSTNDTAVTQDSAPVDEAALLASFCKAATDESINATNLADDAQVEEVAKQMSARAEALSSLAADAPSAVKNDVGAIADAASAMAESLTADPTLANFNEVVQKFTTPDLETASKNVDDFVAKNCEG